VYDVHDVYDVMMRQVAKWLLAAGADVNSTTAPDGVTPLHLACVGGMLPLGQLLLQRGADPNMLSNQKKSPLSYCLAYGHAEMGALLVKHGAALDQQDVHGVTPRALLENRGAVSEADALNLFGVTQLPVRTIERPLHPSYPASAPAAAQNNGGWESTRLAGFETDMHCDIDQYELDEISGVDLFEKYIALQRPVLLRAGAALAANWSALEHYSRAVLREEHGEEVVTSSSIPYSGE
jgi:hypothetical protein